MDFWRKSHVAVLGGGSWGTVLAHLIAPHVSSVRVWVRDEERARAINSTRSNPDYARGLELSDRIKAYTEPERVLGERASDTRAAAIIWALPSSVTRAEARHWAPRLEGDELILHAVKGVEPGTLKRVSQVLNEEFGVSRIGVISGPNLAPEIARGEPAATVVASHFDEVAQAGVDLLSGPAFRVYTSRDVVGVEWCGTLKNILAIAAGALDALKLGQNARALLLTRGLGEMVRFGQAHGGEMATFLGLAGMGDLLATCSSPVSRNFRLGQWLAQGVSLDDALAQLGSTAEGVQTARSIAAYAHLHAIEMPIAQAVARVVDGEWSAEQALAALLARPVIERDSLSSGI